MPLTVIVRVTALLTKHGGVGTEMAGVYDALVVPGTGPRQVPDVTLVAIPISIRLPAVHVVVAIGAVQLARCTSSGIVAAVVENGRNTSVGEKSSRVSA